MPYFDVSAKTGLNVKECFLRLAQDINMMQPNAGSDMVLGMDEQMNL